MVKRLTGSGRLLLFGDVNQVPASCATKKPQKKSFSSQCMTRSPAPSSAFPAQTHIRLPAQSLAFHSEEVSNSECMYPPPHMTTQLSVLAFHSEEASNPPLLRAQTSVHCQD